MALTRWGFLTEEREGRLNQIRIAKNVLNRYKKRLAAINIYNTDKQILKDKFSINNDEIEAFETLLDSVEDFHENKIRKAVALDANSVTLKTLNNRVPESINTKNGRKFKTDPRIIKTANKLNDYTCIINKEHQTFILSNETKYIEGHHIIPMCAQKDFEENLDRIENIATLCPLCHKAIHYANKTYKQELLSIIFNKDKQLELEKLGLKISLEDLLKKYY